MVIVGLNINYKFIVYDKIYHLMNLSRWVQMYEEMMND